MAFFSRRATILFNHSIFEFHQPAFSGPGEHLIAIHMNESRNLIQSSPTSPERRDAMKTKAVASLVIISAMMAASFAAPAWSDTPQPDAASPSVPSRGGILALSGRLTQNKIFAGGDGSVVLELSLTADRIAAPVPESRRAVDMVVVLDRSGSMAGRKLNNAGRAIADLIGRLSERDRFALVSYAGTVRRHTPLLPATTAHRSRLLTEVAQIEAGGGTNLGAGLEMGMALLKSAPKRSGLGRLILISDGLANKGIVDPAALGRRAADAREYGFAVSTVGVGDDFNETLMTTLADRGAGTYYYLANPAVFAEVFQQELRGMFAAAATSVTVTVPLNGGVALIDASGYPVEVLGRTAVFHPGDLRSGQTRRFFLTLQVPARAGARFWVRDIAAAYTHDGRRYAARLPDLFEIACVTDPAAAMASIHKSAWERKVLQ
jgi:Ca-activated chloride channel family protein